MQLRRWTRAAATAAAAIASAFLLRCNADAGGCWLRLAGWAAEWAGRAVWPEVCCVGRNTGPVCSSRAAEESSTQLRAERR